MGLMTHALLYGIEQPEGVDFYGDHGGLLREWKAKHQERIDRHSARYGWGRGENAYIPQDPYRSDDNLLGFLVAVGTGEDGIPALEGCALAEVREVYATSYKRARRRWRRFARWCAGKGITLPRARLYLTETEVG